MALARPHTRMTVSRRSLDYDLNWCAFARATREEAASRSRGLLAVGALLVVLFTLFDIGLDPIRGPVLWTRVVVNATILTALGGVTLALGFASVRKQVFAVMFLLCALVLAVQAYSLGAVSPAPGRLAFHFLTTLVLTVVAIQWPWLWQLAIGVITLVLYVSTVSAADADFAFFTVALTGSTLFTAALARVLTSWRFAQFLTDAELRLANDEKTRQAVALEARNAELKDLFYVLSHDLRAPLINLAGFSHELESTIETLDRSAPLPETNGGHGLPAAAEARPWAEVREEIRESLDFIRHNVARMDELIKGLLELSRIENRPMQSEPVDIGRIVQDIVAGFRFQIGQRRIQVRVAALPVVSGDPLRLKQVFSNLIENAIRYMKAQGPARIDVECESRDDHHLFRIRDTGMGIPREDRAEIFRLFMRLGSARLPGEGLGLTVVKKIIEQHGGSIWVESEEEDGSTFCFTLPRLAPPAAGGMLGLASNRDASARPRAAELQSDVAGLAVRSA